MAAEAVTEEADLEVDLEVEDTVAKVDTMAVEGLHLIDLTTEVTAEDPAVVWAMTEVPR